MTTLASTHTFALENFEGPLDFLLHLVQKSEIDIYEIPIQKLIDQFLRIIRQEAERDIDGGAEFLALAAQLMLIKSRTLLPKHEQQEEGEDDELDPRFEVIHALLEYCQFRDAGRALSKLEEEQSGHHFRGIRAEEKLAKLPNGVEHLSLSDLAGALEEVMERVAARQGDDIEEEEVRVADLMRELRRRLRIEPKLPVFDLFTSEQSRTYQIVIFLAILELMKLGELAAFREEEKLFLTPKATEESDG